MADNPTPQPQPPDERDERRGTGKAGRRRSKPLTDAQKAAAAVGGIVSTTPPV